MKVMFKIKGLDCANCANQLENQIQKIEGVENASISFFTEKMIVEYTDGQKEEVIAKVKKLIKKQEPDVSIEEI